jgi:FAD/FMN-containing dehydrogenase
VVCRPRWRARDLADLYSDWERFSCVRTELDPQGRFLADAQRELLLD